MTEVRPSVVILAGPNGAGKSTAAPALLHGTLAVDEFVNADVIAHKLSADDPESAAIAAGRVMLTRLRELADRRISFAFESTLASRTFAPWLRGFAPPDTRFISCFSGCRRRTSQSSGLPTGCAPADTMFPRRPFADAIDPERAISSSCIRR